MSKEQINQKADEIIQILTQSGITYEQILEVIAIVKIRLEALKSKQEKQT